MKVGICTLGCKVNTYESEYVINELKKAKYYDTGEQEIEKAFRENGFEIIAAEKLTLLEQINYLQKSKFINK